MPTKRLVQKLRELRAAGKTNAEIAEMLNIKVSTIIYVIGP